MTLQRRTPLARKTPLKVKTGLASKSGLASKGQLQRTRIKPMSEKRRAALPDRAAVRAAVFERDGHRCRIKPLLKGTRWERCRGRLTAHHLKKESQGGGYTMDNLISACAGHNDWVEEEPDLARKLGLVR